MIIAHSRKTTKMTSSPPKYSVVPSNTLEGKITFSKPRVDFKQILHTWINNQDKHWQQSKLTVDVLSSNMDCYYLAHWILEGRASGNWSASIGTSQQKISTCKNCHGKGGWYDMWQEWHKCPTCATSGKIVENFTHWNSQSGIANGEINGKVVENLADSIEIQCGKRDFKVEEILFSSTQLRDVIVLRPKSVDENSGKILIENILHGNLKLDASRSASKLGSVKDLKIGFVNFENINVRHWLYPIFIGTYDYEGKSHLIQIDGITGKLHIEIPESIRNARWDETSKIIGLVVGYLALLLFIFLGLSALAEVLAK